MALHGKSPSIFSQPRCSPNSLLEHNIWKIISIVKLIIINEELQAIKSNPDLRTKAMRKGRISRKVLLYSVSSDKNRYSSILILSMKDKTRDYLLPVALLSKTISDRGTQAHLKVKTFNQVINKLHQWNPFNLQLLQLLFLQNSTRTLKRKWIE